MVRKLIATQFFKFMDRGRSAPALCGCADLQEAPAGQYVVKLCGAVDAREAALINELLASLLASHFGLVVASPATIALDRSFVELVALRHPARTDALKRSVGLNFGTRHLVGVSTWPVNKAIPGELASTAFEVFAFDALVQNPDRTFGNPNLFIGREGFTIFDHDAAFSFCFAVGPKVDPWSVDRLPFLEQHAFFTRLKSKPIEIEGFISALVGLSDAVLESMVAEVPPEWENQKYMEKIIQHLRSVRDHAEEFSASIGRVLR